MERFSSGELEVMKVLWERGELKPAEIQQHFSRKIRNAALRSALLVLLEKAHVSRRKVGKAYYYQAETAREPSLRSMARRMAEVFSGGSPAALIAQLIKFEELGLLVSHKEGTTRMYYFKRSPVTDSLRVFLRDLREHLPKSTIQRFYRERQRPRRYGKR